VIPPWTTVTSSTVSRDGLEESSIHPQLTISGASKLGDYPFSLRFYRPGSRILLPRFSGFKATCMNHRRQVSSGIRSEGKVKDNSRCSRLRVVLRLPSRYCLCDALGRPSRPRVYHHPDVLQCTKLKFLSQQMRLYQAAQHEPVSVQSFLLPPSTRRGTQNPGTLGELVGCGSCWLALPEDTPCLGHSAVLYYPCMLQNPGLTAHGL
jgi:hypothetical protein